MLKTIISKFNIYEKYNKLITEEGKKIFLRTVYTLSVCTVAIMLIWYLGIVNLASMNNKEQLPEGFLSISGQALNEKITLSAKPAGDNPINAPGAGAEAAPAPVNPPTIVSTAQAVDLNTPDIKKASNPKKTDSSQSGSGGRKPRVVQKTVYNGGNKPYIALTLDDGYNQKTVIKVLDVLKKNNLRATFFIIGRVLDDYPEVWKRAVKEGHQICNHTLNHATLTKLPDKQVKSEITGWETHVKKVLGEEYLKKMKSDFPYLRLPGGNGNKSERILSIAQECGYQVVGWSLETNSSVINKMRKNHTAVEIAEKVEKHVINDTQNGTIILLHFNEYDITYFEEIISGIKNRGFGILTVTELLNKK